MSSGPLAHVLRHIRKLAGAHSADGLTDRQLLERFAARREEAAFATLVDRHGPMVLGVCRRVLANPDDADDAFQATFLVLARRAGSVRWHDSVSNWLYSVAQQTARKAKARISGRHAKERRAADMPGSDFNVPDRRGPQEEPPTEATRRELAAVLDEELGRLPGKYRTPLVLCYLEGKTNEEAARELGWAAGSMSRHLARARELLRERLTHRGVSLSTGLLLAALAEGMRSAPVSAALREGTVRAALLFAASKGAVAGAISSEIVTLTEGVLRAMFLTKLKIAAAMLLAVTAIGMGAGGIWHRAAAAKQPVAEARNERADDKIAVGVPVPRDVNRKPEARQTSTADQLRAKLAQPITLDRGIEKNTPLKDALEFLAEQYKVQIIVDSKPLEAIKIPNAEETPVSLPKMTGIPLNAVLRLLVSQIRGEDHEATYLVRGNYIEVTSELRARPELWVGANRRYAITVDADYENRPLEQALRDLADMSGISVILDARVVEKAGKTPVTATLNNMPLDTAVRLLADMADLKAVTIDNALYVTAKANAEALQTEQDKRRALAREPAEKEKATPIESAPKKAGEPASKGPAKK